MSPQSLMFPRNTQTNEKGVVRRIFFRAEDTENAEMTNIHNKSKQEERDEEIDNLLAAKGWGVLRIPYEAPMSKEKLDEVMLNIKRFLDA